MNVNFAIRVILSILLASFVALLIHASLLKLISPIVDELGPSLHIARPPYQASINIAAYITMFLPALAVAVVYYLLAPYFPGKTIFVKALSFTALLLMLKGELIRQPLMNFIVGNPIGLTLLQQSQVWLTNLALVLIIAYLMPIKNNPSSP